MSTTLKTVSFALLVTCGFLLGCGSSAPQWQELSIAEVPVRVQMPGAWKEQALAANAGRVYQTKQGGVEYGISVSSLPQPNLSRELALQTTHQVRDAMLGGMKGGTLKSSADTDLEGRPATEFEAHGNDGEVVKCRLYITDRHIVTVMIDHREQSPTSDSADKFFRSVTFLPVDSAAPSTATTAATAPPTTTAKAAPAPPANDRRTAWRYTNAPRVFPDQLGFNGVIKLEAGRWIDHSESGTNDFDEVDRNEKYEVH